MTKQKILHRLLIKYGGFYNKSSFYSLKSKITVMSKIRESVMFLAILAAASEAGKAEREQATLERKIIEAAQVQRRKLMDLKASMKEKMDEATEAQANPIRSISDPEFLVKQITNSLDIRAEKLIIDAFPDAYKATFGFDITEDPYTI